ncbi:MAG TPA: cytochrome c oxidase subunit 3 [Bacteroidia bacterium]|nr:cytochrome c oxidase subunit 3 [Bacteroidia bacterium]
MRKRNDIEEELARKAARNHPLKNLVYFVIAGICMLFLTLMAVLGFNTPPHFFSTYHFPVPFIASTVIIFTSSFFIERARKGFDEENGKKLLNNLLITLGLAIAFAITQGMGWVELWNSHITLYEVPTINKQPGTPNGAYLFIISGLHLLHLSVGLIFLFLLMFKVVNVRSDDVRCVIYFSNLLERARIEMLAKYWHFLGGLWFLLFIYFLWFFV